MVLFYFFIKLVNSIIQKHSKIPLANDLKENRHGAIFEEI